MRRSTSSTSKESASSTDSGTHKQDGASSVVSYLANTLLREKAVESTPDTSDDESSGENIFYLAYGSNLARKTFLGMRGIRPLSQKNVHCPSLTLTFDLGGFPYLEPCFANTRYTSDPPPPGPPDMDYHKTHWKKGVVGVVYEVTKQDFLKILATEGGGASYQDVIVPCYALESDISVVPEVPTEPPEPEPRAAVAAVHEPPHLRRGGAQPAGRLPRVPRADTAVCGDELEAEDWADSVCGGLGADIAAAHDG
ncbi:hypothetical protein V494_01120 [Pseudogymnoascus sp. VKM F-4513 (FW-928)]|nr:hypothetical protein V494_01120 [Pseudogymnoascus sp. VKM F-4513 (FW-928)]